MEIGLLRSPILGRAKALRFRTKVLILLVGMAIFTMGVTVVVLALTFSRILQDRLGSQALSVAATTATFLDGNLHEQVMASRDKYLYMIFQLRFIKRFQDEV